MDVACVGGHQGESQPEKEGKGIWEAPTSQQLASIGQNFHHRAVGDCSVDDHIFSLGLRWDDRVVSNVQLGG